ncbi:MAG: hypothetical protein P8K79_01620 [Mariniblastus sp.]|nr:hypothetical protein [Mariniblastus sp.]
MKNLVLIGCLVLIVGILVGCGKTETDTTSKLDNAVNGSSFLLASEPAGVVGVKAARESVQDNDEVVVVGRIGGGLNPWVDERAAFQIVDPSLLACSDDKEEGESCSCKTPWDYCCETDKLPTAMALVQFSDAGGNVIKQDARSLFNLAELQTVVVKGTAKRDDAGNLTIIADGLYVKK